MTVVFIFSHISYSNSSLNRLNLWLLFFHWFVSWQERWLQKSTRLPNSNSVGLAYSFSFVYLICSNFHSTWGAPKQLKLWMCKNLQKPELGPEPCYEKIELRNRSHTHEGQELRSWIWSHVLLKKTVLTVWHFYCFQPQGPQDTASSHIKQSKTLT